jgi:hypothetical protein
MPDENLKFAHCKPFAPLITYLNEDSRGEQDEIDVTGDIYEDHDDYAMEATDESEDHDDYVVEATDESMLAGALKLDLFGKIPGATENTEHPEAAREPNLHSFLEHDEFTREAKVLPANETAVNSRIERSTPDEEVPRRGKRPYKRAQPRCIAKTAPLKKSAFYSKSGIKIRTWECPTCLQVCKIPAGVSSLREHLSRHHKTELEKYSIGTTKCAICSSFRGNAVVRHIGATHKMVDQFLVGQELKELNKALKEARSRVKRTKN